MDSDGEDRWGTGLPTLFVMLILGTMAISASWLCGYAESRHVPRLLGYNAMLSAGLSLWVFIVGATPRYSATMSASYTLAIAYLFWVPMLGIALWLESLSAALR